MSDSDDFVTPGKKYDADGSECPMGLNCAIHYRITEEYFDNEAGYGRMITYVGNYAVITSENMELYSPMSVLKSLIDPNYVEPGLYATEVIEVGEGSIGDLYERATNEGILDMTRFMQEHNNWGNFRNAHDMVVEMVTAGQVDLSQSYR